MMKKTILILSVLFAYGNLSAQCPSLDNTTEGPIGYLDVNPVDVETDSITIFVDLKQSTHDGGRLQGTEGPVYLWTWGPGDPAGGNGEWTSSSEDNIMTNEGDDIWSIRISPLEFYSANPQDFYECGIFCLVKLKDGSGDGAGQEDKTEDIHITVDPPPACEALYCAFPRTFQTDDYVTFTYNNNVEEDPDLQNMGDDEAYLYIGAKEGLFTTYQIETPNNADMEEAYKLSPVLGEPGKFSITIIPKPYLNLPEEAVIDEMIVLIRRQGVALTAFNPKSFPIPICE